MYFCVKPNIINTFANFLKNNTLALQVLAQVGINQTCIDTIKIGIAVKYGITFEDSKFSDNSSQ
ncbi:11968_t:CDS:2 [Gigaspora margarita]|uniref:11968_t:CDS:1 n=1 Tax=Gigaspora margarita TaxID=4874 RepID=A0ABN7UEX6_GIGMA|nr:11968_t:CDS:2 [Gigaspora margarita]